METSEGEIFVIAVIGTSVHIPSSVVLTLCAKREAVGLVWESLRQNIC